MLINHIDNYLTDYFNREEFLHSIPKFLPINYDLKKFELDCNKKKFRELSILFINNIFNKIEEKNKIKVNYQESKFSLHKIKLGSVEKFAFFLKNEKDNLEKKKAEYNLKIKISKNKNFSLNDKQSILLKKNAQLFFSNQSFNLLNKKDYNKTNEKINNKSLDIELKADLKPKISQYKVDNIGKLNIIAKKKNYIRANSIKKYKEIITKAKNEIDNSKNSISNDISISFSPSKTPDRNETNNNNSLEISKKRTKLNSKYSFDISQIENNNPIYTNYTTTTNNINNNYLPSLENYENNIRSYSPNKNIATGEISNQIGEIEAAYEKIKKDFIGLKPYYIY